MNIISRSFSTAETLKKIRVCALTAAWFLLSSWLVCAGGAAKVSSHDQHFIQQASENSLREQHFGQLIQRQSQNDEVKQLGQKIVQDYTQAVQQLDTLARSLGVTLEPKSGDQASRTLDKIAALSGPEFDRAALGEMIKNQEATVRLLEDASQGGKNPDLRQVASAVLPDLQDDVFQTRLIYSEFRRPAQSTARTPGQDRM
jgi:predicted outer membrane protein